MQSVNILFRGIIAFLIGSFGIFCLVQVFTGILPYMRDGFIGYSPIQIIAISLVSIGALYVSYRVMKPLDGLWNICIGSMDMLGGWFIALFLSTHGML